MNDPLLLVKMSLQIPCVCHMFMNIWTEGGDNAARKAAAKKCPLQAKRSRPFFSFQQWLKYVEI